MKGLAHACLTMMVIPDGLPCNPAMLPLLPKKRLSIEATLSNGYATLERMRKLLAQQLSQENLDDLFASDKVLQIEGNAEIDIVTPRFAAAYTPFNAKYFSVVRNEANPDVEVTAVQEQNGIVQTGMRVTDFLYVGLTAKAFSRKFVKNRVRAVDLGTDAGKDALRLQNQDGVFFTPAATVIFPGEYKPRLALAVANLGWVNGDTDNLWEPIDVQGGAGITFPLGWAEVDVDVDYRSLSYDESAGQRFHLGSMLRFGVMSLYGGVDNFGFSGGVFYALEQVNAGITFSTTQTPWGSNDYYANTVYLQVGWQI
jgi:hypothetical protein